MSVPALDLVVERLVLEGIPLTPEQASTLARLVEEELRLLAAGGGLSDNGDAFIVDLKPVALSQPPDLPALSRVLARRITAETKRAMVNYGR